MYFWENNYECAYEWAKEKEYAGKINEAAAIGAILDLSYCCDLMDSNYIKTLSTYHRLLKIEYDALEKTLHENKDSASDPHKDKLMRFLDCTTIEMMVSFANYPFLTWVHLNHY